MKRSLLHLIVILPGIILLQYHSVLFWIDAVEYKEGTSEQAASLGILIQAVGWSMILEIASFWGWFQQSGPVISLYFTSFRFIRLLAILTTSLLLIGPLYSVSKEAIIEIANKQESYYLGEYERIENEIDRKRKASSRLLTVIEETEDGWKTYNKNETEIKRLQKELSKLKPPDLDKEKVLPIQLIVISLVQAAAIFIIQSIIIIGILSISRSYNILKETQTEPTQRSPEPTTNPQMIRLHKLFKSENKGIAELVAKYGLESRVVKYILDYPTLIKQGVTPFSKEYIGRLYNKIVVEKQNEYQLPGDKQ